MRTLIITNYFPPEIGAASNRIFLMAKNLNLEFNNVEVVCPFPNYPTGKIFDNYKGFYIREDVEKIVCHRLFIFPDNSSSPIKRLFSMLSFSLSIWVLLLKGIARQYDQVIIQNSPILVSYSSIILFKKFLNKKIILNVSDLWPQSAIDLGMMKQNSISHKIFSYVEKFNYVNSDKIIGQSRSILNHVSRFNNTSNFLYRNLPYNKLKTVKTLKFTKVSFIYAGLLGVAQGVLKLIQVLDKLPDDFILHIYGDGKEKNEIINFLSKRKLNNIKYFGSISKNELILKYPQYHFSFAPLSTNVKGAFPSKIYELVTYNIPVIYIGNGEAKKFIQQNKLGYALTPDDLNLLPNLLLKIISQNKSDYEKLVENCRIISNNDLSFQNQFIKFIKFIKNE